MTNLSKELCEICGIKRKRKIFDQRCDNSCKYLDKIDVYDPCKRGNNPCPTYIKYVYPDFEQPENFVKLVNIMRNISLAIWGEFGNGIKTTFNRRFNSYVEEVIYHIAWILKQPPVPIEYGNKFNTFQKQLKQAIRETEWVYD